MKIVPVVLACAFALSPGVGAEKLSDLDVQLLMEKLEALKDGEQTRSVTRWGAAKRAFDAALANDAAAHAFYLKCVEKVRFDDEQLEGKHFREWKRRHKERDDTPAFRLALRHQLYWLTLTLEVAAAEGALSGFGPKAMARIEAIMNDAEDLKGQEDLLRKNVLQTVFATTYGLGGIEVEGWPNSPLLLSEIYDRVIFPPLRQPTELAALRAAWMRRIQQEGIFIEQWGREAGRKGPSVDMVNFLTETRPELHWQMECDLFRAGDEKKAALRLLGHIEKYLGHRSEGKWIEEFEALVTAGVEEKPEGGGNAD